jgi:putative ubiquitin-RnfH superfamily antitoxin RatB of RatAB toxin-antitoxin module
MKTCVVAYAAQERQYLWSVELPQGGTIADAIEAARRVAVEGTPSATSGPDARTIPWDSAPVGIFGELRTRDHIPEDGDRIELYRPLKDDPRERRRQRVNAGRRGRQQKAS